MPLKLILWQMPGAPVSYLSEVIGTVVSVAYLYRYLLHVGHSSWQPADSDLPKLQPDSSAHLQPKLIHITPQTTTRTHEFQFADSLAAFRSSICTALYILPTDNTKPMAPVATATRRSPAGLQQLGQNPASSRGHSSAHGADARNI